VRELLVLARLSVGCAITVGCGSPEATVIVEPSASERLELTLGQSVELSGTTYRFSGLNPGEAGGPPAIGLEVRSETETRLSVALGHCARGAGWVHLLETFHDTDPVHIARARPPDEQAIALGAPVALERMGAARLPDGTRVQPRDVRFSGRARVVTFQVENPSGEHETADAVIEAGSVASQQPVVFGDRGQYLLSVRLEPGRDPLGCHTWTARVDHPAGEQVPVTLGEPFALITHQSAAVGDVHLTLGVGGTMRLPDGTERAMTVLHVSGAGGDRDLTLMGRDPERLTEGLEVALVSATPTGARLRISQAPPR